MNEKRYTLKKDGRYYSANGAQRGFMAHGIGACYSFPLEQAVQLRASVGGDVVEVIRLGGFKYAEGPVTCERCGKLMAYDYQDSRFVCTTSGCYPAEVK